MSEEHLARKKPTDVDLTEQSVALSDFATNALATAKMLRIKTRVVGVFPWSEAERVIGIGLSLCVRWGQLLRFLSPITISGGLSIKWIV